MLNLNIKHILNQWTTQDLLITAIMSIVFSVILAGLSYLFIMFIIPLGLLARSALQGIWYIPALFIAYTLRRPGSVLISESMIRLISIVISPYGWLKLVGLFVVALPAELAFSLTGYRNFNLPIMMLIGAIIALIRTVATWIPLGISLLALPSQIAVILLAVLSGISAGLFAKILADSIAKTGVLNRYAIGKEFQEEV